MKKFNDTKNTTNKHFSNTDNRQREIEANVIVMKKARTKFRKQIEKKKMNEFGITKDKNGTFRNAKGKKFSNLDSLGDTVSYCVDTMKFGEAVRKVNREAATIKQAKRNLEDAEDKVRGCKNFLAHAIHFHKEAGKELSQVVQEGKL